MTKPLVLLDPEPRTRAMILTDEAWAALHDQAEVISQFGSRMPDTVVERHLADAVVIIGQTPMPTERLARAPKLRVRSTLLNGVPWGITMVAGMAKRWAW